MSSDWPVVNVGQIADSVSQTHKLESDRLVFLNTSDVLLGRALHSEYSEVRHWPGQAKKSIRRDDILFSEIRPANGRWAFVDFDADDFVVSTKLMVIRSRVDRVLPRFLYHFLTSPLTTRWLQHLAESRSGTFPQITFDQVAELELSLPPLSSQRAIVEFLDAVDARIELNRSISETLESIARSLFTAWFVDFEPPQSGWHFDGSIPGASSPPLLVPSDLGLIPQGWRSTKWGELLTLEYGKSLDDYAGGSGAFPVFGTNGKIGTHSEPLSVTPGIVIGRKGAYRGIHYSSTPFFVIDTAFYAKVKLETEPRWAYYALKRYDLNGMDSGSAIPSTSRDDFYALPAIAPPVHLQKMFVHALDPLWSQQERNEAESSTLTVIREVLLPRLISGEIKVKEAENDLEHVL